MSRTPDIIVQKRLLEIEEDINAGTPRADIIQNYSKKYNLSQSHIYTYLKTVEETQIARLKADKEKVKSQALSRKEYLYRKALEKNTVNGVKVANEIDNDALKLQGIYLDKEQMDVSFSPVQVVFNVATDKDVNISTEKE
jgi:hypothetical protein